MPGAHHGAAGLLQPAISAAGWFPAPFTPKRCGRRFTSQCTFAAPSRQWDKALIHVSRTEQQEGAFCGNLCFHHPCPLMPFVSVWGESSLIRLEFIRRRLPCLVKRLEHWLPWMGWRQGWALGQVTGCFSVGPQGEWAQRPQRSAGLAPASASISASGSFCLDFPQQARTARP